MGVGEKSIKRGLKVAKKVAAKSIDRKGKFRGNYNQVARRCGDAMTQYLKSNVGRKEDEG